MFESLPGICHNRKYAVPIFEVAYKPIGYIVLKLEKVTCINSIYTGILVQAADWEKIQKIVVTEFRLSIVVCACSPSWPARLT